MKLLLRTFIGCLLLATPKMMAQSFEMSQFCATPGGKSEWLQRFQQRAQKPTLRFQQVVYVPVVIHLVGANDGSGFLSENVILDAFCKLNDYFAPSNIQFFIKDKFDYIRNSAFFDHISLQSATPVFKQRNVARAANVYFVQNPMDACGYNYKIAGESQAIVLGNGCTDNRNANWAHEMGHYLSLPHTFNGWENYDFNYNQIAPSTMGGVQVEMIDGSNCSVAGDGFCDTQADYLNGRWYCGTGSYQGMIPQFDPEGRMFYSDGSQIMSYAMDPCPTHFSKEQIIAMQNYLGEVRSDQIVTNLPVATINIQPATLMIPTQRANVPTYDSVYLRWHPAPQATGYILEFSPVSNFALVSNRYVSYDTTFIARGLKSSRTYYWRLRPFNSRYTCKSYSEVKMFTTGSLTPVHDLKNIAGVNIYPNPVKTGEILSIDYTANEHCNLQVDLINGMGQLVNQTRLTAQLGENRQNWSLPRLPAGLYTLILSDSKGSHLHKIMINE